MQVEEEDRVRNPDRSGATAHRRASLLAVAMLALFSVPYAMAQSEHEHAHDHAQAAVGQLKLNDGEKWATDAPLRAGMAAIESAFEADHAAIHAGTATNAQYEALAGRIEAQVNSIVANCKLPPDADANLHYVIADLSQGVSLMRGGDAARTRHDGAALVHGALRAYDTFFDAAAGAP
jgi:hypothetical protein